MAVDGKTHFAIRPEKLPEVAAFVAKVSRDRYPDLKIPFHARMAHFQVGGVDRVQELNTRLSALSKEERCRAQIDLIVVSVLLDAGAGPQWRFQESGRSYSRSEGLAVASFRAFSDGL